jgi:serine/threonine protein kinase
VVPERLGDRYRIVSELRTTPVYREVVAHDERRQVDVKLWLLDAALADDAGVKGRFLAAVQSWLDAPVRGGLRLQAGGVIGGTVYLRVPPGRLECLRTRLLRWKPSLDEVTHIVGALVGTMRYAHERCWLHGLLTARDVLFTAEGSVAIAGIGLWQQLARKQLLAALAHESHSLAPEVRAGDSIGMAGDLFSVAAITAELLQSATGATTTALRRRGWNPLLVEAVDRLLANAPAERPSSFSGLATALEIRTSGPEPVPGAASGSGPVKATKDAREVSKAAPAPRMLQTTTVPRGSSVVMRPPTAAPADRTTPEGQLPPLPTRLPRASAPPPRMPPPGAFAMPPLPPPLPPPPPVLPWIDEHSDSDVPTLERSARRAASPSAAVGAHPRLLRRR